MNFILFLAKKQLYAALFEICYLKFSFPHEGSKRKITYKPHTLRPIYSIYSRAHIASLKNKFHALLFAERKFFKS
jgi:hypothetical protein